LGRAFHGLNDFQMRPAPTQDPRKRPPDLFVCGIGILIQKRFYGEDYAVSAVPALGRLLVDEGLLNRVRMFKGPEPLQREDFLGFGCGHWSDARANEFAAGNDCARSALAEPTTKLRPVQPEVVPQDVEKGASWIDVNRRCASVDS
jgi:hypothetical protein